MKKLALSLAFVAALLASDSEAQEHRSDQHEDREVRLQHGGIEVLVLNPRNSAISDLLVGNPEIADALPLSGRRFAIVAKKEGFTNVLVLNEAKEVSATVEVAVVPPTEVSRRAVTVWAPGGGQDFLRQNFYRCHFEDYRGAPPQGMPCYFDKSKQNLEPVVPNITNVFPPGSNPPPPIVGNRAR